MLSEAQRALWHELAYEQTDAHRSMVEPERICLRQVAAHLVEMEAQLAAERERVRVLATPALREALARYAHKAWSLWMVWLFTKWDEICSTGETYQQAWRRQMTTTYDALSERDKASDRQEAEAILAIVRAALAATATQEGVGE